MPSPAARFLLLLLCTSATFLVSGRAAGAVNLRTREIEIAIASERKPGRERGGIVVPVGTIRVG